MGSRTFSDIQAVPNDAGTRGQNESQGKANSAIASVDYDIDNHHGHDNQKLNELAAKLHGQVDDDFDDEEEDVNYKTEGEAESGEYSYYDDYSEEEVDDRCPAAGEIFYERSQLCVPRKCSKEERRDLKSGNCYRKSYLRIWFNGRPRYPRYQPYLNKLRSKWNYRAGGKFRG